MYSIPSTLLPVQGHALNWKLLKINSTNEATSFNCCAV